MRYACAGNLMPKPLVRAVGDFEEHVKSVVVGSLVETREVGSQLEKLGIRVLIVRHLDLEKI